MLLTLLPDRPSDSSTSAMKNNAFSKRSGRWFRRIRNDLRLAIVTLYSLCALVIIGPFVFFRLANGELAIAIVDSVIMLSFIGLAALAWQPAWTNRVTSFLAIVAAAGTGFVVLGMDLSPMWVFSTLVGNFLMAERRLALAVNSLLVIAVALQPAIFQNGAEYATFVAVAVMTSLFSTIFAKRMQSHHQQLSELATRDGLTGVFNRRMLDHDLEQLNADSNKPTHTLVLLDLDDFKRLNDELGHETGDAVLRALARAARKTTRKEDRFYRYGGEEFVLLLANTPLAGGRVAVANLRREFKRAVTGAQPTPTFSAGLAQQVPGQSVEAWLSRADRALREAKQAGKNCCRASRSIEPIAA
ncbi:MAG: GGDEF domain-containing protein [Wenzhouxiangella sp.]|jgi:diguanylate cyclase (GGDEF)-like protein|nr:GGDEF domain-containing protein [Wenzhouxiangella sp.]